MNQSMRFYSYADLAAYVAKHAAAARHLDAITALLDADRHTVWLDRYTVWHAWTQADEDDEPDEDEWYLSHESADTAADWIRDRLDDVFERLADPSRYARPAEARCLTSDEEVMGEFYDIELAFISSHLPDGAPAREVDQVILRLIGRARAEAARLASLRAHHARAAFLGDGGRGWKAAAARGLGITPVSLGDVLKDDEARAERRRQEADTAQNAEN
jgi:hypothetical protein